ncbi:MAG: hypothetical protein EXQ87_00310 [Alphaproteobacteria bacterium]|nr:hypothetical protein [Alphaproteobacteria bacterium]
MRLRMRQICLVARDLDQAVGDLTAVFGLGVCYKDPSVAKWGLDNALMPIGNDFLEVVAPVKDGTAAGRYLDRRQGDGGYMVILQTDDLAPLKRRVGELAIRIVHESDHGDYKGLQLHPRDVPPAILSVDWDGGGDAPDGPWHPAGPDWRLTPASKLATKMRAAELQGDDPAKLAAGYARVLDRPVATNAQGQPEIRLDDATLRFVPMTDGRGEGLGALDLVVADRARVLDQARARGSAVAGDVVTVAGMRFRLI